jgi:hypothetical protein
MSTLWWLSARHERLLDIMTTRAYAYHTNHTMATILVRTTGTFNGLSVDFDEELFYKLRTLVLLTMVNVTKLHNIYKDAA